MQLRSKNKLKIQVIDMGKGKRRSSLCILHACFFVRFAFVGFGLAFVASKEMSGAKIMTRVGFVPTRLNLRRTGGLSWLMPDESARQKIRGCYDCLGWRSECHHVSLDKSTNPNEI
jgi:hypothetical protein